MSAGRRRFGSQTTYRDDLLLTGSIHRLPRKDEIETDLLSGLDIDDGCFDHPIVVLPVDLVNDRVTVLIVTSFGGQDIEERFPKNHPFRNHYLPISPGPPHPDNGELLFLDNNNIQLRKKFYLKTTGQLLISPAIFKPYDARYRSKYKLTQESFNILVKFMNSTISITPFLLHNEDLRHHESTIYRDAMYSQAPELDVLAARHHRSQMLFDQRTQTLARSYSPDSSHPTPYIPIPQVPVRPFANQLPALLQVHQDWSTYRHSWFQKSLVLLGPEPTPSTPKPQPGGSELTGIMSGLLKLGLIGFGCYGAYRLLRWFKKYISETIGDSLRARAIKLVEAF